MRFPEDNFQLLTYSTYPYGKDVGGKPEKYWIEKSKDAGDQPFDLAIDIATFTSIKWGIMPTWYDGSYHVKGEKEVLKILSKFFDEIGLPRFRRSQIEEVNEANIGDAIGELFAEMSRQYETEHYKRTQNYEIIDIDDYSDEYSQEIIFCNFVICCRKLMRIDDKEDDLIQ